MTEKSPLVLDPADPVHADVLARLAADHIGWFTTVRADGSPHAVPVWFLWHAGRLLVMSEPRTATAWLPEIGEAYTAKYAAAMVAYGMGLDAIAEKFHVVIELEPTDLQAW